MNIKDMVILKNGIKGECVEIDNENEMVRLDYLFLNEETMRVHRNIEWFNISETKELRFYDRR